jgi:hypothetical protein
MLGTMTTIGWWDGDRIRNPAVADARKISTAAARMMVFSSFFMAMLRIT